MFKRILVSTDDTPRSDRAVKTANVLAAQFDASLVIFHAAPSYKSLYFPEASTLSWPPRKQYEHEASTQADKVLAGARALGEKNGVKVTTATAFSDAPSEAIIAAAKKAKADLIVMASHGRQGMARVLIGSETQKVLTHTKIPVLVVR